MKSNRVDRAGALARVLAVIAVSWLASCSDEGGNGPDDGGTDPAIDGSILDGSLDSSVCDKMQCGTSCVDIASSPQHCGACDHACGQGQVCSNGACTISCAAGRQICTGSDGGAAACVDTSSDRFHCGACDVACPVGNMCVNGSCQVSCPGNTVECEGSCVDPLSARGHCGAITGCGIDGVGSPGVVCPTGSVCGNGVCQVSCPGAQIDCVGVCTDPATDLTHCGGSTDCVGPNQGATCAAGNVCTSGVCALSCAGAQVECNGECIDPMTDRGYCGALADCDGPNDGSVCGPGEVCSAGHCAISCPPSQIDCSGTCVDPLKDRGFCGASGDCQGLNAGDACAKGEVCNEGDCAVSCPATQINCGGVCIDPSTNRGYCGASTDCQGANDGTVCAVGQVCNAGTCAVSCQAGLVNCNGTCVNPQVNRDYCGASADCQGANDGAACAAGQVCSGGTCVLSCQAGLIDCDGTCIDPRTDRGFCGASTDCTGANRGAACAPGQVCAGGTCALSCQAGLVECDGTCIPPATSRSHCGAALDCQGANAGSVCAAGELCSGGACALSCQAGLIACDGTCLNPLTDRNHCGAVDNCQSLNAGTICMQGEVCSGGQCVVSCPGTEIDCDGTCVEPETDRVHCGATADCQGANAGTSCSPGEVCSNGRCTISCASTQIECSAMCVDPLTDRAYCGATGDCQGPNAGVACPAGRLCANGACAISCPASQIECNGVCIDPLSDRGYCGASADCQGPNDGNACLAGQACTGGVCSIACPGSQINCNGLCVNPQTNRSYCGASGDCQGANDGMTCASGEACSNGTCVVSCPGTQINCNGQCINPQTNRTYCGASGDCQGANDGTVCGSGQVCSAGVCAVSCPGTEVACQGTCVDPQTDGTYCGASGSCTGITDGTACASGQICSGGSCGLSCVAGQINCNGSCVQPLTNRGYCGASGNCQGANAGTVCSAGQVCSNGTCSVSCPGSQIICNGRCIDPQIDRGYCGATGNCLNANDGDACQAGQVCSAGACVLSCLNNQINCGGTCIDPLTSRTYCGAVGNCQGANAGTVCSGGQVCSAGTCALSCPSTQIRCNGTCIDPTTDTGYCGASGDCQGANDGNVCLSGQVCQSGVCSVSCLSGRVNCNGTCIDPSSNPNYCGASGLCTGATDGTQCTPFQGCVSGTCLSVDGRMVFLTNDVWTGADVGGLAGADAKCQAAASAANLLGSYRAWLSDATNSAASRMTHANVRYVRVDGVKVADNWTDLTDGTLDARINLTETGDPPVGTACGAWTNSSEGGANVAADACQNWTSSTGSAGAADATSVGNDWSQGCIASCALTAPLLCIEQ